MFDYFLRSVTKNIPDHLWYIYVFYLTFFSRGMPALHHKVQCHSLFRWPETHPLFTSRSWSEIGLITFNAFWDSLISRTFTWGRLSNTDQLPISHDVLLFKLASFRCLDIWRTRSQNMSFFVVHHMTKSSWSIDKS